MSSSAATKTSILLNKSPLVVVSNRLPFVLSRNENGELTRKMSAGGLVTAVSPVVVECGGLWVGWPGLFLDDPNTPIPESLPSSTPALKSDQIVPVHVDKKTFEPYYNGCCNGTFWPLFHSMPGRAIFNEENWKAYKEVNNIFAIKTMEAVHHLRDKGMLESQVPILWIHDYQLMLMASNVRQMLDAEGIKCKLGFFLHIPFPPWDIFRIFPWNDVLLQGMLGCDMVGFHIEDYCTNFIDCCQRQLGSRVDRKRMLIEFGGRTVAVHALPIGIPYRQFVKMAKNAKAVVHDDEQRIILGVERLDYTKGLIHRIKSFERLLEMFPQHKNKVQFLQVAVPSRTDIREYQLLKEELDQLVGRINGRFSTPNWSPIRYIYGCINQEELAAFYRDSSVALVTPLRDGMNLVAKEFVACQVSTPGVLILSPFTGAAGTMREALIANPYEINEVARYLDRALTMDLDEKELRMNRLRKREEMNDVDFWLKSFINAMRIDDYEEEASKFSSYLSPITISDFDDLLSDFLDSSCKVTLLLDYDGTLAPIAPRPELAILPEDTKKLLERLSNMNDVRIAVVSGRSLDDIRNMVGLEGITYAGSQGLEILYPDGITYLHPVPSKYEAKIFSLTQQLQEKCCQDGAWVENKGLLLTYHYRQTSAANRDSLKEKAKAIILEAGFKAVEAQCAIEAWPKVEWDQGKACLYILRTMYGLDWQDRVRVIYAGDDTPDENVFSVLKGIAATFRVAPTGKIVRTDAAMRLAGTDAVYTLLKWVEKHVLMRDNQLTISPQPYSFSEGSLPARSYSFGSERGLQDPSVAKKKLSHVLCVDKS